MMGKFTVWSLATMKTLSSASVKMERCVCVWLFCEKTHHSDRMQIALLSLCVCVFVCYMFSSSSGTSIGVE